VRRSAPISLLLALCAAALGLGLAACGGGGGGTKPLKGANTSGQRSQLVSIFGGDGLIQAEPDPALVTMKSLGVQVVRYDVAWSTIAPRAQSRTRPTFDASDPSAYPATNWAFLDNLDKLAASMGIKLYFTLTSPAPLWATGANPPASQGCSICSHWEPSATDFHAWVTAMGKRYGGHFIPKGQSAPLPRVSFWSIWNEPNYGPNLAPQSTQTTSGGTTVLVDRAAPQYRKLLDAGWSALNATGHTAATDTILIGETAPRGVVNPMTVQMTSPLLFARDLYCVSSTYTPLTGAVATAEGCPSNGSKTDFAAQNPGLFKASGWADHPYADGEAPTVKAGDPAVAANFADFARLPDLATTLDKAAAAWGTDAKLPIWSTEYGYFTRPPLFRSTAVAPVTAARYLNWSEYLSWKNPRIASYDQYLLQDPVPTDSQFDTGLESDTGLPKALAGPGAKYGETLFAAFRLPLYLPRTTAGSGQSLTVWGCARPVLTTSTTSKQVRIQLATNAGHFKTIKTVTLTPARDGCYFQTTVKFAASGNVRLAYRDGASDIFSRPQAITIQ
jgi:hypothetical protein